MADLKTYQITGVLAYDVTPNVKVYGGAPRPAARRQGGGLLRQQLLGRRRQQVGLRLSARRRLRAPRDRAPGGAHLLLEDLLRPRHRRDDHPLRHRRSDTQDTNTDVDTPQSVQLDFQTGVAPKTLVFGYVRWVDWSEFSISPPVYEEQTAALLGEPRPLVDYADDWWTYNLGIGRQLTDALAGSLSITYEPSVGGEMTSLGPYDGRTTGTAGAQLRRTASGTSPAALTYGVLGDTHNLLETDFNDGSVWGAGLRVGYTF